ncbi:MAG TPA: hypothetical protein PKM25_06200 [Candidatus Ozemobacteraceae bacterium]|nr:hypothetical protein [Candidatus Ozemobacteraceae bacterium]
MKRVPNYRLFSLVILALLLALPVFAGASFELTSEGVRYIVRDDSGQIVQTARPDFDPVSGAYYVRDTSNRVIAQQTLSSEAAMSQIKIVAPAEGNSHSVKSRDFLGNSVPVLRELTSNDSRYQQLKGYIDNDPGLRNVVAMQLEARNMKIDRLQQEINTGVRDPKLAAWLVSDLKKPVYLEVGDSGSIYHDPKGFILAERDANGQVSYRDNSSANRLVIPTDSEAFQGGMNDSSAASVMAHEVGHMIMDQTYETPNYPKTGYAGAHAKNSVTDEGFAISEGWAEAIETIANKDRLDNSTSWRVQSQKNIAENKYIFKNQGVVSGANDGILKTGTDQLSTEGVNASLFYKMLTDNHIQAPYQKVLDVFENSKPQTYRDFLKSYVEKYPEDRSQVIKNFLEDTKYTTVDSTATTRYKALHDAEQAWQNAPADQQPALEASYKQQLAEYNQWKEQAYQQTVVDGKIDRAVGGEASIAYSDNTTKQYKQVKLSETLLKGKKALGVGLERAADSVKQSFSLKNVAMTAGTSIAVNLVSQIASGEKPSFKKALSAVTSMQFVGNVVGSSMGAAAGHLVAPLIQAFVPIPVVGAIAGSLLPTLTSIAGGQFGGNLGAGMSFRQALKSLDPVAIAGQAVGSTIGSMLGAMIPIPVIGPMIGGMVGGILGEKLFTGIAKLFGRDKKAAQSQTTAAVQTPTLQTMLQDVESEPLLKTTPTARESYDPVRLDASIDSIPYENMHSNLRIVKDDYEAAYKRYVEAASAGDQQQVKSMLNAFIQERERYRRALGAYRK